MNDGAPQLKAALAAEQARTDRVRAARIAELASQLKRGTYKPDPNQIAQRLLDRAELEARLQAMLKG